MTDPIVTPHTYTYIEDVGYQCNDCGASAETEEEVQHYPTCKPGESQFWADYYDQQQDDEPVDEDLSRYDDDPSPYEGTLSEE